MANMEDKNKYNIKSMLGELSFIQSSSRRSGSKGAGRIQDVLVQLFSPSNAYVRLLRTEYLLAFLLHSQTLPLTAALSWGLLSSSFYFW